MSNIFWFGKNLLLGYDEDYLSVRVFFFFFFFFFFFKRARVLASTQIRDKSKACLMRALLWFIGIPYKITVGMIRSVKKVCHNASRT